MRRFAVSGALALAAVAPGRAAAQGFGIYEQSACVMGRAGTGVASPCADGSSIYYNPANIAGPGNVFGFGGTLIAPRGSFTNSTTGIRTDLDHKYLPVPNVYLTRSYGEGGTRWGAGIGLFAPYGLTTEWPADFEGSFVGEKSVIRALYLQPTVAVRLKDRVAIGAGVDVNFAHVELKQLLDLSTQFVAPGVTFANLGIPSRTAFGEADLTANGTGYGFHVGISVRPIRAVELGARYMSRQKITFDNGTAAFTPVATGLVLPAGNPLGAPAGTTLDALVAPEFGAGGLLSTQRATAAIRFPDQLAVGAAVQVLPALKLLGEAQWSHWAVFDVVPITFETLPSQTLYQNNHDIWTFRLGGEYAVNALTTVRAGYYIHDAAEPPETVTPNLPEGNRASFTVGAGTKFGEQLHLDLAYQYIDQADRQGRTVNGVGLPTTALNSGVYRLHAHLFGLSLGYAF
jgi:long-chain fatty acid transport protein